MGSFESALIIGVLLLFISLIITNEGLPAACTMDAKICPDGSEVGRDALDKCEFFACPNMDLVPYCTKDVLAVEKSGEYTKTTSSLLGGGFTVYSENNITRCPVVSPLHTSAECKDLIELNWTGIQCVNIDVNYTYQCPFNYFQSRDYKWINCEFAEFNKYCNTPYAQWIRLNCDVDVINMNQTK
ncbi:MAG TPA: hypothetical protein VI790_00730 [Candidatus Nanoarchaeia archaeon]|nr:hypothetical protein [Candidatus Nanoarchaeia archaeon]